MSASPRVVARSRRSAMQTPVMRQGPRVVLGQRFTNDEGTIDMTGDGSMTVEDGVLEVITGTEDTVLETRTLTLLPGVTYLVLLNVVANEGTIMADIDGVTVIPATSETGLVTGSFKATSLFSTLTVTASGASGAVITLDSLNVRIL